MIPGEQRPTARDTIVFVPHLSAIVELGERERERERETEAERINKAIGRRWSKS